MYIDSICGDKHLEGDDVRWPMCRFCGAETFFFLLCRACLGSLMRDLRNNAKNLLR